MRSIRWLLRLLLPLAMSSAGATATLYFPGPEAAGDPRQEYSLALLRLALDKAHADYRVENAREAMRQSRAIAELASGSGKVHIVASMTSSEREATLLPIRIPLDRGLLGWRIALVPAERADMFKDVKSRVELARYFAGQESDWPDAAILRANGLGVVVSTGYGSLFKMLSARRFDYFPRSAGEIVPEAEQYRDKGLTMDRNIVLHYPAALYFFVNRADAKLADAIRAGLETAIADDSFEQLFQAYYGKAIAQTDLGHRIVIELENPLLPAETPLQRRELWIHPSDFGRK
jgi:ABC-type amino acid transport substrate-binding protein